MKKILIFLILFASFAFSFEEISERDFANLTPKERKDLALAQQWINRQTTTSTGTNGEVTFLFGQAMPSIVTAPLRLTNITLEEGEVVKDIQLGDSARWILSLSSSGENPQTSHVVVKPTDTDLQTTLNIMTDRRIYVINLVSENKKYMPVVKFAYADQITNTMKAYREQLAKKSQERNFSLPDSDAPVNTESLNFEYAIKGNTSFTPIRVYDNNEKTYIQLPKNVKFYEAPVLMVLNGKESQLVNYRLKNDTYVVDGLFDQAILIADVGSKQKKVTITKKNSKNNRQVVDNVLYDLSLAKERK